VKRKHLKYDVRKGITEVKTKTAIVLSTLTLAVGGTAGLSIATLSTAHANPKQLYVSSSVGTDEPNHCQTEAYPCKTIGKALSEAVPGTTIHVYLGVYNENININVPGVSLKGYHHDIKGAGVGAAQSTVHGTVTISAPGAEINGFQIDENNSQANAVVVGAGADQAVIKDNEIENIASGSNAQAVYLQNGPDTVRVSGNSIHDISSVSGSAKGVYIGDSNADNSSDNELIQNNDIYNVTSGSWGAYGVLINAGSHDESAPANNGLVVQQNDIHDVATSTGWVHAIGLEADTPGADVNHNAIETLNGLNRVSVWLESENVSYSTVKVNSNEFRSGGAYGIEVDPSFAQNGPSLDGTCNNWNSKTGPSVNGPGNGVPVSTLVNFSPWTVPGKGCIGGIQS